MLNYIWLALMIIAIVVGAINGKLSDVTEAAFDMAETSVTIAFGLIGIMALWLGIMKIAEDSGMVKVLAKAIKPISKRLFPDVPSDHPAIASILLNLSANWLGLSNAATPLGLKAMEDLQKLNEKKDTASNAMVTFLALNTAAITLIPATIIGVRISLESNSPQAIIGTTIFAGVCATTIAIIAAKILEKIPIFNKELQDTESISEAPEEPEK
ncbi:nucleoside recognition protein [candidate division KSB1 bacterium]|nr:nucleoside recognition protein [candidate division KSB1 bacterium]NIR71447.1 nucleoside recognition protein [candidate division KSB1 bacterium]NIS23368.1 nucleoside recognition protein [candidate division KSB1 bacterium]NIT70259.1 nucleoside recognition protein [candidate division KSB1 bacterium]NIU23982.1 nucleoside recognition protein [candidate division KSB1 bacterium]